MGAFLGDRPMNDEDWAILEAYAETGDLYAAALVALRAQIAEALQRPGEWVRVPSGLEYHVEGLYPAGVLHGSA